MEELARTCAVLLMILLLSALILALAVILGTLGPAGADYRGGDTHDQTPYGVPTTPAAQPADLGQEAGAFSPAQPPETTPTPRPPATATAYQWPTCGPTGGHEGCAEKEPGETLEPRAWLPGLFAGPPGTPAPTATSRPTPGTWIPTATNTPRVPPVP